MIIKIELELKVLNRILIVNKKKYDFKKEKVNVHKNCITPVLFELRFIFFLLYHVVDFPNISFRL